MEALSKRLFSFLCCLSFIGSSLCLACPSPDCVRMGSWNIEWLGSELRSQPSGELTIQAMASLIAVELSIDLISLEEINTQLNTPSYGKSHSKKPWLALQKALSEKGYQTVTSTSDQAQQIVFAWRAPLVAIALPTELPVRDQFTLNKYCRSSGLRKPLAGHFKAEHFDFWAIGLHLKAKGTNNQCTDDIRKQQVSDLLKAIQPLETTEPDIILMGDFNSSQKGISLAQLSQSGFHALHTKKLRAPNSNSISYHSKMAKKDSSGTLIDHILVRSAHTKEWIPYSPSIYKPKDPHAFANTYSDHLPIWADFSTLKDDD